MDSGICQDNLNSGFQSLVGFRIPRAVFRTQKLRIPDTTSKVLLNSGSHKQKIPGFWNPRSLAEAIVWSHANNPIVALAFCVYNTCFVCSESRATVLMSLRWGVLAFSTSQDVRRARNDKYTRNYISKWSFERKISLQSFPTGVAYENF